MPFQPEDDTSSLERMRKRLYAPDESSDFSRVSLAHADAPPARTWEDIPGVLARSRRFSGATIFFAIALVFFATAAVLSLYLLIGGTRAVSTDKIAISVQGPTTVAGGDTVPFLITIENRNPVPLSSARLTVDFPEGTRSPDDVTEPLIRYTESIEDVAAGETIEWTVRAVLFGEEKQIVRLPITFEYRTLDSSAVYVVEKTYDLEITTSPLSINVTALSEAASGQPFTFTIAVRSNATAPLSDIAVRAEYPFGFSEAGSSLVSESGSLFTLGGLAPGEEKKFTVTGILTGPSGEERTFRFTAGTKKQGTTAALSVAYVFREITIALAEPFLAADILVNGDASETVVARAGVPIQALLSWTNTLPVPVLDGEITVALTGSALDTNGVTAGSGFYRSIDATVLFDRDTDPGLRRLEPGDRGNGSLTFKTKTGDAFTSLRNPAITLTVSIAGRRVGETQVPEQVSSTITRTVQIATDVALSLSAVRTTGPFENMGPWPPKADAETTYTVMLGLRNTVNGVADGIVSMTLPSYVRFMGLTSPADGSVSYNSATRQVRWSVGEVVAGTGYGSAERTAAFQIGLTPSVSQKGTSPVLVQGARFSGFDRFTQRSVESAAPSITTETTSDPAYQDNAGEVQ